MAYPPVSVLSNALSAGVTMASVLVAA